jgi:hypothetical protein
MTRAIKTAAARVLTDSELDAVSGGAACVQDPAPVYRAQTDAERAVQAAWNVWQDMVQAGVFH